jgi:UDP-3-O-[3-hydroxymyristoyl] glucosamine N-acyltransferase
VTNLTGQAVADLVGGRLHGPGSCTLARVAALDRAGPDALSILSSPKYLDQFRRSRAGAVIVAAALADEPEGPETRIVVEDPTEALLIVAREFDQQADHPAGVHPSAILGTGIRLGHGVSVGPQCVLGNNVQLGDGCRLGPGVLLEEGVIVGEATVLDSRVVCHRGTVIGHRVLVQAGAILGGVGFGFHSGEGGHRRLPHIGRCIIEDDVEIGSNTCIDRGSVDDTVIGAGTKIDNLVQIAHNVRIGKRCFIAAEVGISGSCRIGDEVVMAGQVGIAGHLTVGDRARLAAQSGLSGDVPESADYGGTPARPHRDSMRGQAAMLRLGKIMRDLEALVKERRQGG